MKRTDIPDHVRHFILSHIPSVPYLEALLLLRSTPADTWDARQLARRLYMSERAAADVLTELNADGLLAKVDDSGIYRYMPSDASMCAMVDQLAHSYAGNLVGVSNLIHSRHNNAAYLLAAAQMNSGSTKK